MKVTAQTPQELIEAKKRQKSSMEVEVKPKKNQIKDGKIKMEIQFVDGIKKKYGPK